jgi:hypothetical protein
MGMSKDDLRDIWSLQVKRKEQDKKALSIISDPGKSARNIRSTYEATRKKAEDEIRILIRGIQARKKVLRGPNSDSPDIGLTELNMIHAIADNAITGLLPVNPKVSCRPLNDVARDCKLELDGYFDLIFAKNRMHAVSNRILIDCLASGYGAYEVLWNSKDAVPRIRDIKSNRIFFDPECRDVESVSWYAVVEPISFLDFADVISELLQEETYCRLTPEALNAIYEKSGPYPDWLLDPDELNLKKDILELQCWITIWKFYDILNDKMVVYIDNGGIIAIDQPLPRVKDEIYIPFVISTLAANGHSATGVADCATVLPHQRRLSAHHNLMDEIAAYQKPKTVVDANMIKPEDMADKEDTKAGALKFVSIGSDANNFAEIGRAFFVLPKPEFSNTLLQHAATLHDQISYLSTISDPSRGQAANIRTATEASQIEANSLTRLGSRRAHFFTGLETVAMKCFQLAKANLTDDVKLSILANGSGYAENRTLALNQIINGDIEFEPVGYNPARNNPKVLIEALHNSMGAFTQLLPPKNVMNMLSYLLKELGAPPEVYIIKPEDAMPQNPAGNQPPIPPMPLGGPGLAELMPPTPGGGDAVTPPAVPELPEPPVVE